MSTSVSPAPERLSFISWFDDFLKQELSPYPGRSVTVARMVIAATITMILIMTFRVRGGALGVLYAFFISRDSLSATLASGLRVIVSYAVGVAFVLAGANLFADKPFTQLLWFSGSVFIVFFALRTLRDYAVATGIAVLVVNALPIWQMGGSAETRVEDTLWQALAVAIGTAVTIAVEIAFRALHARDEVAQGIDERLTAVSSLLHAHSRGPAVLQDIQNTLARYTIVGVSGLRRVLARSSYERLYRDQLTALVALTGRLVDLSATAARIPYQLSENDRTRVADLAARIDRMKQAISANQVPTVETSSDDTPSAIPLLVEMEKTVALIPRVFSGSESIDAYFPSVLDQESHSDFFVDDAFRNPEHLRFATKGCLAATLCYVTYSVLDWPGIATSVTTCVLTALSNVGTSRQKQVLRVAGATAGGLIFGIGSQVFILPNFDTITCFALLFAVVTAVAAWFATSSQRLSYFGIQLALAFYLITLQEFKIQTSLAIARDRVVGILLGLSAMWLVFERLGIPRAAEEMVKSFVANLRAIASLMLLPTQEQPEEEIKRVRVLREYIYANFQSVNAQSDAVPFEFGHRREQGMAARALVRSWQPSLRALYLMEAALLQHRIFDADKDFPKQFRAAERRFHEACADILNQMADHLEYLPCQATDELAAPLDELVLELATSENSSLLHARELGVVDLSKQIASLLSQMSKSISGAQMFERG
jgi:multidrug resistance protein MdtO